MFAREKGRISAVNTPRGELRAAQILLAAGVWSAPVARELGVRFPLQPAKGYSITVPRPPNAPRKYLYLGEAKVAVTPMGERLRYAGTLELAGFDFSINRRRVDAILRAADAYLVQNEPQEAGEIWRGMRPCSPDGLPYIGRSRAIPNLIVGTGHAMLGMSMGPITGKLLGEIVQQQPPSIPLQPFRVERFS